MPRDPGDSPVRPLRGRTSRAADRGPGPSSRAARRRPPSPPRRRPLRRACPASARARPSGWKPARREDAGRRGNAVQELARRGEEAGAQVCGVVERTRARHGLEVPVARLDRHRLGPQSAVAQAEAHFFAELVEEEAQLVAILNVLGEGALHSMGLLRASRRHAPRIDAVGEVVDPRARGAENAQDLVTVASRELSDGGHAQALEALGGAFPPRRRSCARTEGQGRRALRPRGSPGTRRACRGPMRAWQGTSTGRRRSRPRDPTRAGCRA